MIMPLLIINTYVSLMYELKKNWKGTDELICWDRALVLWKKNLLGRGLTKVDEHCSTVFRFCVTQAPMLFHKNPAPMACGSPSI